MNKRTLTFVYHVPFWKENNQLYAEHPAIGRYVETLADHVSRVIIAAPRRTRADIPGYPVNVSNAEIICLPAYQNVQQFWTHVLKYFYLLWQASSTWDMLHVRMPTHAGFPAFLAAALHKRPVFLVVVGEGFAYSRLNSYPYFKQKLADLEARFQDFLLRIMVAHSITFTNGKDLFQKLYRPGYKIHQMRSSTIRDDDLGLPDKDTCQRSPYKILTVGTISPRKGTSLIPEVIAKLREKQICVDWYYVGQVDGNSGEHELRITLQLAKEYGITNFLKFLGLKQWNQLSAYYHDCDLFVLPTYMEGIPRVILEAQAAGLPIITTKVGGIPQAVSNREDALLVDPGQPEQLAHAIEEVIRNKALRQQLIRNGIESAKHLTIDVETQRMFEIIDHELTKNDTI